LLQNLERALAQNQEQLQTQAELERRVADGEAETDRLRCVLFEAIFLALMSLHQAMANILIGIHFRCAARENTRKSWSNIGHDFYHDFSNTLILCARPLLSSDHLTIYDHL
jgi:hypothetical protein